MTSRRWTLAIVVAVAVAAGACRGGLGSPQLSYKLGYGNAGAPPGTSRGASGTVIYRDQGGILSRIALFVPRMMAMPEDARWNFEGCDRNDWCLYTTTQGEIDAANERYAKYQDNLFRGQTSLESIFEYTTPSLGGDTFGLRFSFLYPLLSEGPVLLKAGVAYGASVIDDRTTRYLNADATTLQIDEMMSPDGVESSVFALPLKLLVKLPAGFLASYQFDWNLLRYGSIGERPGTRYHPQLSRFGIDRMLLPFVHAGVELQVDGLGLQASSINAELGLAF